MNIAVLSDIHDHLEKLEKALEIVKTHKAEAVIFCGDLSSGFMAGILAKANIPTYACLGNNDEDHIAISKISGEKFSWFSLSKEFGEVEIDGKKIAFCHYPKLAELLANGGGYDAVFYGHTHIAKSENINQTLLLNPGAICGINFASASYDKSTLAIYNTDTNSAEIIEFA